MGSSCCKSEKEDQRIKAVPKAGNKESALDIVQTETRTRSGDKTESEQIAMVASRSSRGSGGGSGETTSGPTVLTSSLSPMTVDHAKTCSDDEAEKLTRALNKLAVSLYAKIVSIHRKENVVFSPLSIAFSLALIESSTGTIHDHPTRDKLQKLIGPVVCNSISYKNSYCDLQRRILSTSGSHDFLRLVASIICDNGIKLNREYAKNLWDALNVEVIAAPLQDEPEMARQQINGWFSEKTSDKIPEMVKKGRIHAGTSILFLLSAAYIKMKWDGQFDVAVTKMGTFYQCDEHEPKTIPFVVLAGRRMGYAERDNLQLVEIPYLRDEMSLYVILPKQRDGLVAIEHQLDAVRLIDWFKSAHRDPSRHVHLELPQKSVRSRVELLPVLKMLGVQKLDRLTLMTKEYRVHVSDAIHEAYFEVNEYDSSWEKYPPKSGSIPVIADHPYLFAVVHNPTGSIVFMGKVNSVET